MASGKKFYKRPKFITLIIALLIAAVAVPKTLALTERQAKKLDVQAEAEEIEKTDSLVWGKEVNGLRAAVEFVPEKESYEQGEVVGIRFHLQNVSNQIINLATPRWWIRSGCFAEDRLGIKIPARTVPEPWGMTTIDRHKLLPGRVIKLESGSLAIAKDKIQRNSLCKYPVRNVVTLKPGRYSLYYWLRFPGITRLDGDGKVIVPQPDDWQGALETGKRKLVITSNAESDQKPDVQVEGETTYAGGLRCSAELIKKELAFGQTPELAISLTNTTNEPIDIIGYCRNSHSDRYPLPCAQLYISPVGSDRYRISSYDFGSKPEAIRIAPGKSWSFEFPPPKMKESTTTEEHRSSLPSLSAWPPGKYTARLTYFIRESEIEKFAPGLVFGAEMGSLAGKKPDRIWQGVIQSKELAFEVLDDNSEQLRIRKAIDSGEGVEEHLQLELKASKTRALLSVFAKNNGEKTLYLGAHYCLRGKGMGNTSLIGSGDIPIELKPGVTLELGGWNLRTIGPGTYWVEYLANFQPELVLKKSNTVTFEVPKPAAPVEIDDGKEVPADRLIVPGRGVGDYKFGMSKDDVLKSLKKTKGDSIREAGNSISLDGIILNITDDSVKSIDVLSPLYRFANGLGIGSSEQQIIQAFGSDFDLKEYQGKDFLTYEDKGLVFEIYKYKRTVMEISVLNVADSLNPGRKTAVQVEREEEVSKLVERLKSENRRERCQAALKLESLGDRRGVPAIIKELKDTSYRPTDRNKSDGREDQEGQVRQDHYYAALLLGILGDKRAVPALIEATRDETIDYQAAMSLGQIGDKRAIPALHDMLDRCSNKPFPRLFAGYGLAMLGDKEGLKVVIDTLNNQQVHWTNRRHAIEALSKLRDKEAVPYLIAALKDEHPNIRASAAKALGAIGNLSALPALKQALEDKTETKVNAPTTVSEAAAKAIAQIEGCGSAVEGEEGWGQAVEGIQVRLRPDKRIWNEGDDPSFKVDIRNNGTRELETCLVASIALEVDGKAYAPRIWFQLPTIGVFPFGPGSEYTIKISCSNFNLNGKGADKLTPGKHTIRAVYLDNRDDSGIHTSLDNYGKIALAFSNPVEIEILPKEKPAEHVDRKKVWGQAVNGLRAAVEFVPEKESYDLEERVGVRFHIQNVSNEDVQFSSLSGSRKGKYWPTVKDSDGKEVKVDTWEPLGTWSYLHHIIKPGQILTLKNTGLIFSDFHDSALLDKPKWIGIAGVVRCGPGQYSIYYKLSRTLETGVRKVTVNERPPVNPRSFELTLDQQSMLQAIQTLRRKYRVRICLEQAGSESGSKQHLLTGTFFAPTIPELLDKLTETSLYKWEKFYLTYAVYPKRNSLLRFSVKTDISESPLESVAKVILDQNPSGEQIEIEAVYKGRMRTHLWISRASAMYALSGATAWAHISNSDVVWTLTLNQGVPRLYLHRLSQALQTNEQIKADMPDEKDQLLWGEPVDGVQVRLRTVKSRWNEGAVPRLWANVHNQGVRNLLVRRQFNRCELEVDGRWYRRPLRTTGILMKRKPFPPGRQYDNIAVDLDQWWELVASQNTGRPGQAEPERLKLTTGKHTIRVAFTATAAKNTPGIPVRAISNPVKITIGRALPGSRLSIEAAAKEKAAFAAVCEAVAKFIPTTALSPRRDPFDTLSQEVKVVEVLFGKAEAVDRIDLLYKVYSKERAIRKHERVIWIGHTRNMSFHGSLYGLKALPDTPENRQAVKAAASQSATKRGQEVNGKQDAALQKFIRQYSKQKIICLDIGEQYTFRSHNGIEKLIRLASVKDYRDTVVRMVRRAEVVVVVNGKAVRLVCEPYTMPTVIDGLRIQADTTSGWRNIAKRVQLSIWDANDPIVDTRKFCFPIKRYLLFSHGLQAYNEVRHLGHRDGDPGHTAYHDYGIDLGGYDGGEDVVSCCSGRVVSLWPKSGMARSVSVQDEGGLIWLHTHLDSVVANIVEGVKVSAGQKIGVLGKKGHSGNFSHLHLGTSLTRADLTANRFCRRLNLYPWIVTAFQEKYGRNLYAVARPHQVVLTGEEVIFDGSKSLAYDAKIVDYRWEFEKGQVVHAVKAEKVFDKPVVYMGTLRVRDEQGNEDVDFCRVKVFTRDAPEDNIATIYMTHTPTLGISEGQEVLFQFWIQGGKEERISIDFGDGATLSDYVSYQEVRHKFDRKGIYIITATANVNGLPIMGKQRVVVESSAGRYLPADSLHRAGLNENVRKANFSAFTPLLSCSLLRGFLCLSSHCTTVDHT